MTEHEENICRARELLPGWFVPRMMNDVWSFGLLLSTRQVLCIESIRNVYQAPNGSVWLDVELGEPGVMAEVPGSHMIGAPTSRTSATVQAAHIVAAFELADT